MTKNNFLDFSLDSLYKNTVQKLIKSWDALIKNPTLTDTLNQSVKGRDALKLLMRECIIHPGGEVTARKKTIELGYYYLGLLPKERKGFLKILASEFDINKQLLDQKLQELLTLKDKEKIINSRYELKEILEPDRVKILRQFASFDQGIKFLVDLRKDVLELNDDKDIDLISLDKDLKLILSQWFDVGLLDIREINWSAPASLLEKLIQYEAVHAIKSWNDLKNRLDSDRKCYAFFHHKMASEPLIFIEVALSTHAAAKIDELLDESAPVTDISKTTFAIFYSISNTQKGLTGISFGNFLIKQVVEKLSHEFDTLKKFITLSPIPGFRKWLETSFIDDREINLSEEQIKLLKCSKDKIKAKEALLELVKSDWLYNKNSKATLEKILPFICAYYLSAVKKDNKAYDPVAHFHLNNGAQIEQINFAADISERGLAQSCSLMVNYRYKLPEIDENHENYNKGIIKISDNIKKLLQ